MKLSSQDKFTKAVKRKLVDRGITVTALAKQIDYARNTVSMAIHHPIFPRVRTKIVAELDLSSTEFSK